MSLGSEDINASVLGAQNVTAPGADGGDPGLFAGAMGWLYDLVTSGFGGECTTPAPGLKKNTNGGWMSCAMMHALTNNVGIDESGADRLRCPRAAGPPLVDDFIRIPVRDEAVMQDLQELFTLVDPASAHIGKDVPAGTAPHSALRVEKAWVIQNAALLTSFWETMARTKAQMRADNGCLSAVAAGEDQPVFLLHGTDASNFDRIWSIVCQGANRGRGLFGDGLYLANAADKMNQYGVKYPTADKFYGFVMLSNLGCQELADCVDCYGSPLCPNGHLPVNFTYIRKEDKSVQKQYECQCAQRDVNTRLYHARERNNVYLHSDYVEALNFRTDWSWGYAQHRRRCAKRFDEFLTPLFLASRGSGPQGVQSVPVFVVEYDRLDVIRGEGPV